METVLVYLVLCIRKLLDDSETNEGRGKTFCVCGSFVYALTHDDLVEYIPTACMMTYYLKFSSNRLFFVQSSNYIRPSRQTTKPLNELFPIRAEIASNVHKRTRDREMNAERERNILAALYMALYMMKRLNTS